MRRVLVLSVMTAPLLITACGAAAPPPAAAPPALPKETQAVPSRPKPMPPLIAPPPAYGNKVVMAKRDSRRGTY